jgi:hypothetical protein
LYFELYGFHVKFQMSGSRQAVANASAQSRKIVGSGNPAGE